ncbi:MAG: hypothetical protein CXT72_05065 [Methanobacteriota archaeon]|nr:MAG: hypothetical protein CXT72_05065 [Euryarchaeota archaeon]
MNLQITSIALRHKMMAVVSMMMILPQKQVLLLGGQKLYCVTRNRFLLSTIIVQRNQIIICAI